jgi:amino-acid N-acetyltransferase
MVVTVPVARRDVVKKKRLQMIKDLRIRAAQSGDESALGVVLEQCGLPADDVIRILEYFHVAELEGAVIGCAAGQRLGDSVLVRSVAVLPEFRDQRVATHLVGAVLMRARANGARRAVLLTTSSPTYFSRYGFTLVDAARLPQDVRESREFGRQTDSHPVCMWCELK